MATQLATSVLESRREPSLTPLIERFNTKRRLIRREYGEMPGLSLTEEQVERMWHLDGAYAHAILQDLLTAKFLCRTCEGTYVRADAFWR